MKFKTTEKTGGMTPLDVSLIREKARQCNLPWSLSDTLRDASGEPLLTITQMGDSWRPDVIDGHTGELLELSPRHARRAPLDGSAEVLRLPNPPVGSIQRVAEAARRLRSTEDDD